MKLLQCKDEVREGSVQSNHPKLMWRTLSLPLLSLRWCGLVQSNHPELMWDNSTYLGIPAMMWFRRFEEVRCTWTTPNLCKSTLHTFFPMWRCSYRRFSTVKPPWTLLSLRWCGLRRFSTVQPPWTHVREPHHHNVCGVLHMSLGWCDCLSNFIFTGVRRCAECLCTISRWFKHTEPLWTYIIR